MNKALTQVPIGAIKSFLENNFKNVSFSPKAEAFFENEFLGSDKVIKELIELKDGSPKSVQKWLKEEHNIETEMDGDYAIASVLSLCLEFLERADFSVIDDGNIEYAGGTHYKCNSLKLKNKNGHFTPIYKLCANDSQYEIIISEDLLDNDMLNNNNKIKENSQKTNNLVNLTLPLVRFKEELDFSEDFIGTTLTCKKTNNDLKVDQVKSILLMDLGLDKVKVKQAATMVLSISGCAEFIPVIEHTIKDNYFIYVRYNNKLLFASQMKKEDFIKGEELRIMKDNELVEDIEV